MVRQGTGAPHHPLWVIRRPGDHPQRVMTLEERRRRVGRMDESKPSVVVVGGGFAGVGCAKELAKHGVSVAVIDRNNYHQFQPLLYQVATAELATTDIARPLRGVFKS